MPLYLQLEPALRLGPNGDEFRQPFLGVISQRESGVDARVVVVDPDLGNSESWQSAIPGLSGLVVVNGLVGPVGESREELDVFVAASPGSGVRRVVSSAEEARFLHPDLEPRSISLPNLSIADLRTALGANDEEITLVSIDLQAPSAIRVLDRWSELGRPWEVSLTLPEPGSQSWSLAHDFDRHLRTLGYSRAGRLWGEAGSTAYYRLNVSLTKKAESTARQIRVKTGSVLARVNVVRQQWDSHPGALLARRRNPLDYSGHQTLSAIPAIAALELASKSLRSAEDSWEFSDSEIAATLEGSAASEVAQECRERLGVWPISFSYPGSMLGACETPSKPLSYVIPGFPYAYSSEDAYRNEYHESSLALTFRKAGWDCFRHVEILAAGSVPLMPDVDSVPRYSMVHYPKEALNRVHRLVRSNGGVPGPRTRAAFAAYATKHLSSRAMASYVLEAAGLRQAERILFVDEALPAQADYLSVVSLLGFKQLFGAACVEVPEVDYVYRDSVVSRQQLYGRGFGYAHVLEPDLRATALEPELPPEHVLSRTRPDVLVIGSVARNYEVAREYLRLFPAHQTVWLHGEDYPPTLEEARMLRLSGVNVFVRAIEPRGSARRRGVVVPRDKVLW